MRLLCARKRDRIEKQIKNKSQKSNEEMIATWQAFKNQRTNNVFSGIFYVNMLIRSWCVRNVYGFGSIKTHPFLNIIKQKWIRAQQRIWVAYPKRWWQFSFAITILESFQVLCNKHTYIIYDCHGLNRGRMCSILFSFWFSGLVFKAMAFCFCHLYLPASILPWNVTNAIAFFVKLDFPI